MKYLRAFRQPLGTLMFVLMLSWQVGQPLQAATFYWDSDATAVGNTTAGANLGGTGNWDTSAANWWNTTNDVAWPNVNTANTDLAIFSGAFPSLGIPTANTVTLSSGIIANSLSFVRSGYTLTGGTLTLDGTTPTLRASLGESAIINSQILGTVGLTKTGGGSVRLGNATNNTYTGVTSIIDGTLVVASNGALGGDSSAVVVNGRLASGTNGGSLLLAGNMAAGTYTTGFTLSRNLTINDGGGSGLIASDQTSFISAAAGLVSVGNNMLSGTLTTAPPTTTANPGIASAFGLLTLGNVVAGGTSGTNFTTFGSTGSIGNYAITGTLSGTGSVQKSGASSTLDLSAATSSGSGTLRISAGSVRIVSGAVLGSNAGTGTSGTIDLNAGSLEVRAGSTNTVTTAIGKTIYQRRSSSLFVDHAVGSSAVNGTVTFGNVSFEENTTLTLNGRNGYGITLGAYAVNGGDNISTVTNNLSGLLTFTGAFWSNTDNGAARTMTIGGNGDTLISGNFTASATSFDHVLTKTGTGTLTLSGTTGTLDGAVNINGGTLAITDFRSINLASSSTINIGTTTTAGTLNFGTATASTAAGLTSAVNGTTLLSVAYAAGASTVTLQSADGIVPGATITGTGIAGGTTVASVAGKVVTLSTPATGAGTVNQVMTVAGVTTTRVINLAGTTGGATINGAESPTDLAAWALPYGDA
jgi:autotransporter-associated beta strand protein